MLQSCNILPRMDLRLAGPLGVLGPPPARCLQPTVALCYDPFVMADDEPQGIPERATPLLAIVRIVSVLGMSFGVALGIFLALAPLWLPSLAAFAFAVPFFLLMRYMEKHAGN
jgi:hypothetical protein